jgi:hypothetical protein
MNNKDLSSVAREELKRLLESLDDLNIWGSGK